MKILVDLFNFEIHYWFFEHLFYEYPQITKLDYVKTHNGGLENWRQLMPYIRKAVSQFGKHDIDWENIARFDQRRGEVINALPAHAQLQKEDFRENPKVWRIRTKTRKRRAYLLYYYYLWRLQDYDMLFVCNGMETEHQAAIQAAHFLNKKITFFEIGPFKDTITIDSKGVNYQNSLPRNIDFYRQWSKANPSPPQKANIGIRKITHMDFLSKDKPDLSQPYIFLPLPVYSDKQILFFNDWVRDITHLITLAQKTSARLPQGWRIIAKEHPSNTCRFDCKRLEREHFIFANAHQTPDLIKNAELILTLNSAVGLEAMIAEKPIITLGQAFYAFNGLTHQCHNETELMEAIQNPSQISFNHKDRQAFLNYLINEYYLDGDLDKETFIHSEKNRRIIQQRIGLKWQPHPKQTSSKRKNLVITAVGQSSIHQEWMHERDQRNWDLLICDVADYPQRWKTDDVIYTNHQGGRFDAIYQAFKQKPELLNQYDYVMMIENDIHTSSKNIDYIFELMRQYKLQIAQPAFDHQGYSSHLALYHNPQFRLRYTNFIERRFVCMSITLWKEILPLYENNPNAYHIELFWNRLVDDPTTQVAILDEVQAISLIWSTQKVEWQQLQETHQWSIEGPVAYYVPNHQRDIDEWWQPRIVCHSGILADGTLINNRDDIEPYLTKSWKQILNYINRDQSPREQPIDKRLALTQHGQKNGRGEISKTRLFVIEKNKTFLETTHKKNLIIVRAGKNSLHQDWLKNYTYDQRNWDLLVSYYDIPSKPLHDDIMNIYYKGGSKDGIYDAFQQIPHLLEKYDYIMMADDDFQMTAQDLNRTFEIMKEYNLQIGQPSFTYDSYSTFWQLFHNPYFKIRYTNYTEANTVCLHRKILQQILPLYENNPLAWFIDTFWHRLTDNPARQVAMIDEIQIKHTRPLKTGSIYQHDWDVEGPLKYSVLGHSRGADRDDLDKWYLKKIVTHAGILKNGRTIKGRWFTMLFLLAGWLKAAKYVDRLRNLDNRSVHQSIRLALKNQIRGKIRLTKTRFVIHGSHDE